MCCPLVFEFSVGIGGFFIGLGQISFFFSSEMLIMEDANNGMMKRKYSHLDVHDKNCY